jgi:hypothetical protein
MLPDKIEHCIVFMNYWDVFGVFWIFSKCNIKIPHLPADPSICVALLAHRLLCVAPRTCCGFVWLRAPRIWSYVTLSWLMC